MPEAIWHSTTVICVRKVLSIAMAGDGQVTLGETVIKGNAVKIRKLFKDSVLADSRVRLRTPSLCLKSSR